MRHLNLKSIALPVGLVVLVALGGCGGSPDQSTAEGATAPIGKSETTTNSSPAPKQKTAKRDQQAQKKQKSELIAKQVEKEVRKLAESGQPIPADSPVAKKIIQSLTGNGSGKQGKKGKNSISKVIEEVVSPSPGGGGGGSSSGGQGSGPSAGVEKILEQLQK